MRMFERRCRTRVDELDDGVNLVVTVAAARAAGEPFALVCMDIQMRLLGGMAAARALRAAGDSTPLVAVTGESDVDPGEVLEAGFVAVLTKPVSAQQAMALLRRWTLYNNPAWAMA